MFERQSDWIHPGQRAEVELDYLPGKRLQGTVDYIYPELDRKTRTLKVRLRFEAGAERVRRVAVTGQRIEHARSREQRAQHLLVLRAAAGATRQLVEVAVAQARGQREMHMI